MKITSVLFMDAIEPSLEFWVGRLGFTKTVEVPHGAAIGFVILEKEGLELMLQTRGSVGADLPFMLPMANATCGLFIEVDSFEGTLRQLEGVEVVVPVRITFYGMQEIVVREPGGNCVCFAAKTP